MKKILFILFLFSISTVAQDKYLTRTGLVQFEASVPTFEEVKAKCNSATAILNTKTGEFAALVLVKGFRFKNALMEEHFNENYAESDQYPKATFKGSIENFSKDSLQQSTKNLKLSGELNFHGQTKIIEDLNIKISKTENAYTIKGHFIADASDYNIKVPRIVRNKIAKNIKVSFEFILKKKPSN